MTRIRLATLSALTVLALAACGEPPGSLEAQLHWPARLVAAAPAELSELRFIVRGGGGYEHRRAVPATAGAWRSDPLAAGTYRLEAVALAGESPVLRAVTAVTVHAGRVSRVDLVLEPLP